MKDDETLLGIFERNRCLEAIYKGEKVYGSFDIQIKKKQKGILRWISRNPKRIQGITIRTDKFVEADGMKAKGVVLWEDKTDRNIPFFVNTNKGFLRVYNHWLDEKDRPMSGMGYAAMKVKQDKNKNTFYCNDGQPNDDFTDLVFSIELLGDDER